MPPTEKKNGTTIEFPKATSSWGTIYYFFVADAQTGGNVLVYGQLVTPKTVDTGDQLIFDTDGVTFTVD